MTFPSKPSIVAFISSHNLRLETLETLSKFVQVSNSNADSEDNGLRDKGKRSKFPRCSICREGSLAPENSHIVSDGCKHRFCKKCLEQYAELEVKSGKSNVKCPEFQCEEMCSGKIIEQLLPTGSLLLLVQREVEEAIPVSERVYCPFPGCSALHVIPTDQASSSSQAQNTDSSTTGVECFSCNRYFCFSCKVTGQQNLTTEICLFKIRVLGTLF